MNLYILMKVVTDLASRNYCAKKSLFLSSGKMIRLPVVARLNSLAQTMGKSSGCTFGLSFVVWV